MVTKSSTKNKITLADIASTSHTSISTVSKVLNGSGEISSATRQKVEKAISQLGYKRVARSEEKASDFIEVVFKDFDTMWSLEVLSGILKGARKNGVSVVTTETHEEPSNDLSWLDGILRRRPRGIVLVFSDLPQKEKRKLKSRHIPYVILDPAGNTATNELSVRADNWSGGLAATRYLLQLGFKRIGTTTGPLSMLAASARLDGYTTALKEAGITPDASLIKEATFNTEGGYQAGIELLSQENRPEAIFAGSDLQAFGIYEAARQLGLSIPEDLSVIGFDDIRIDTIMGPALTTIRQPLSQMAEYATDMITRTDGDISGMQSVILPTKLIVRDSTRSAL